MVFNATTLKHARLSPTRLMMGKSTLLGLIPRHVLSSHIARTYHRRFLSPKHVNCFEGSTAFDRYWKSSNVSRIRSMTERASFIVHNKLANTVMPTKEQPFNTADEAKTPVTPSVTWPSFPYSPENLARLQSLTHSQKVLIANQYRLVPYQEAWFCTKQKQYPVNFTIAQHRERWRLHQTPPVTSLTHPRAASVRLAVALDCEMGVTIDGTSELLRVSLVDIFTSEVLIDSLVDPTEKIIDYKTQFSGVSKSMLDSAVEKGNCFNGRDGAREAIFRFVGPETIVVMHSGFHDLNSLRWIHSNIIDTCLVNNFKHHRKTSMSLRVLTKTLLGMDIQVGGHGHDSTEDAMATRGLAIWFALHNTQTKHHRPVVVLPASKFAKNVVTTATKKAQSRDTQTIPVIVASRIYDSPTILSSTTESTNGPVSWIKASIPLKISIVKNGKMATHAKGANDVDSSSPTSSAISASKTTCAICKKSITSKSAKIQQRGGRQVRDLLKLVHLEPTPAISNASIKKVKKEYSSPKDQVGVELLTCPPTATEPTNLNQLWNCKVCTKSMPLRDKARHLAGKRHIKARSLSDSTESSGKKIKKEKEKQVAVTSI